jgi:hypothetical protein
MIFFIKNFFPRTLPKSVGFEDKGQGFPKKLFYCSKSTTAAAAADLRKTAVLLCAQKTGIKKNIFLNFGGILVLSILEIIMQKNKSEKIILSAPKTATTLIIAGTLNIAPTVLKSE